MTQLQTPQVLFADARVMHEAALKQLAAGDVRDAAEKAWCATKRATDALILARTGNMPESSPSTRRKLKEIAQNDSGVNRLKNRYFANHAVSHVESILSKPSGDVTRHIRETINYIEDAERLAGV